MKFLIDMNLSNLWVEEFIREGWEAKHWIHVGRPSAPDIEILEWAAANGYIVFTHDLDFSAILATSRRRSPSVIQLRSQDVLPDRMGSMIIEAIRRFEAELVSGAVVSIDPVQARARLLPLLT